MELLKLDSDESLDLEELLELLDLELLDLEELLEPLDLELLDLEELTELDDEGIGVGSGVGSVTI